MNSMPEGIAIIGMAGRFPGANNLAQFWENLCAGVESIVHFSDQELEALGVSAGLRGDPHYVKAAARLDDVEWFDAAFFGYTPKEAAVMDPQHRLFLECAWEALEEAGYAPQSCPGSVGVYAGAGANSYLAAYAHRLGSLEGDVLSTFLGNAVDFLATRVSYKLNLKGPSLSIQTACSTSLVAVHLACQSLLHGECDMALAGGVSIKITDTPGYFYQEGGIASPDGHCRAFDARAQGTLFGDGVGIVVLKRAAEAQADGDHIYAVIRGSAINNDGASKVGYTAPSVNGQARVIGEALALAGVKPETLGYIEAHGTGTALGDPVEIAALSQVFRASTPKTGFCAVSSVKTNIGHLDAAAGIASLIKTALILDGQTLPPSLHFEQPNPEIDFANSPFFVNTKTQPWKAGPGPRRAGVSSFGMGGTNAHVVMEEAPAPEPRPAVVERPLHLLALSAKTPSALRVLAGRYGHYFALHPDAPLADVCFTANAGRTHFAHRLAIVAASAAEAHKRLAEFLDAGMDGPLPLSLEHGAGELRQTLTTLGARYMQGVDVDWTGFDRDYSRRRVSLPTYPFERQRYWLDAAQRRPVIEGAEQTPAASTPRLREDLEKAAPAARLELMLAYVHGEVAQVLGLDDSADVDPHQGFFDMGMESLTALELKSRLEKGLGCALPTTFAMNYSTVETLAAFVTQQVLGLEISSGFQNEVSETASYNNPTADAVPAELDELSEDELAALLDSSLDQILGTTESTVP